MKKPSIKFRLTLVAVAVAGLLGFAGTASAFDIPSDNPDIRMAMDNILRYNAAWRVKDRDPGLANNLEAQDESDFLFNKNDMINNRIELYSEFDFKFQERMGFRISAQAWYDAAYDSHSKARPDAIGQNPANQSIKGTFNNETKRYYHGPSGEFLDHFVWWKGKIGDTDIVARFGRHAVIWGEGVVGNAQAVSYAQAPSDGRKSLSSPGAGAKETALPINQTTGTWQFRDNMSLSWQYTFEWNPNRFSLGGTYLGPDAFSDTVVLAPAPGFRFPRVDPVKGDKGAYGLMYKWHEPWLGTDVGVVYRKFSDTNPLAAQRFAVAPPGGNNVRYVFAKDITLWGLTFNNTIYDVAVGGEISHRHNMALLSRSGAANGGLATDFEGPKGDTWHALVNGTFLFNKTAIWDNASLLTELTYTSLDKVTKDPFNAFKSRSTAGAGSAATCGIGKDEIFNSCATHEAYNLALVFTPTWLQVYPGLDLSLGNTYVVGLKGNAPANGGGNEGSGQYKINLGLDYHVKHRLDLAYTAFVGKRRYIGAGLSGVTAPTASGGLPVKATVGGGTFADRDYASLVYTYNF